jgi:CelD/BcsL family acetyltransferase involved in cellulose biosynthesis
MSATDAGQRGRNLRRVASAPRFRIAFFRDPGHVAARLKDFSRSTPFQDPVWLDAWYASFTGSDDVEPLIASISERNTGQPVALVPLITRLHKGIRIIEFADLGLTDYNAPLLSDTAPQDVEAARTMWRDLQAALRHLPEGPDLLRLSKMPAQLSGGINPFAQLDDVGPCSLNGTILTTGDDFDTYRYSLARNVRKELERSWRVFTRDAAARFRIVTDEDEALRILSCMDIQQSKRMQELQLPFFLDNENCASFFRTLVKNGLGSGYAVVTALTVGEEIVAALLGIRRGPRYVMVRISNAGGKWSNCSPGRLIIERSMAAMHMDGVREFDFSIVEYPYKKKFGVEPLPLFAISAALSWRGWRFALQDRAAYHLRRYPTLAYYVRRALRRPY